MPHCGENAEQRSQDQRKGDSDQHQQECRGDAICDQVEDRALLHVGETEVECQQPCNVDKELLIKRPIERRNSATNSADAPPDCAAMMSAATPGARCSSRKFNAAMARTTGTTCNRRLRTNLSFAGIAAHFAEDTRLSPSTRRTSSNTS